MHIELYLAFVLATTILMLIPGPNVGLIVANSLAHGPRYGLLTVAGTSSAMVVQLVVAGSGLTALLGNLAHLFAWVGWIGAVYLIFLGIRQWRAAAVDLTGVEPQKKSVRVVYARGFLVSLTNPKTLFFLGAFFPQFLGTGGWSIGGQMVVLSITFLGLAVLLDSGWALGAARLRGVLAGWGRGRNRIAGGVLIGAGVGLGWAGRK